MPRARAAMAAIRMRPSARTTSRAYSPEASVNLCTVDLINVIMASSFGVRAPCGASRQSGLRGPEPGRVEGVRLVGARLKDGVAPGVGWKERVAIRALDD